MWRAAFLAILTALTAGVARAAVVIHAWDLCASGPTPVGCKPFRGVIDPQGRELWLRAAVPAPAGPAKALTLHVVGAMSSELWFNGVRVGANGQPGPTAAAETPGRYEDAFLLHRDLWRPGDNQLVVRLSAFHSPIRFDRPFGAVWLDERASGSSWGLLAATFVAAGALLAAAFGFGAVFAIRRTGSTLILAAMAGLAALQALTENLRHLSHYPYPLHAWRVGAIWVLAAAFALLLVAYFSARFAPRRRRLILRVAAVAVPASILVPGFDFKAGVALLLGVLLAGWAAALGVRDRLPGARLAVGYLAAFLAVFVAAPEWLLDVSFFMLAAGLTLPLLAADVVRLGRDDADREAALTRAASRPDRLTVATARGVELTPLADILAIVGADDYAELRLRGGRSVLHAARLERLEAQLPASFIRVHRSAIANLAFVQRLERDGGRWRLHLAEGLPLPVSRARLAAVRDALELPPPAQPAMRSPTNAAIPGSP